MWFGAESAGYYDGTGWTTYTTLNGLVGNPVQAIDIDPRGRVWIGTGRGLSIFTQGTSFNLTRAEGLPSDDIRALLVAEGADGSTVWIGTNGGGLLHLVKNQIQVFMADNANLPSNSITALAQDADGSLLVGTDRGVARFVDGSATAIRPVGDVSVTTIATGADGVIWVGTTNSGAFYFNGLAWQQFTGADALPSPHISTVLVARDGTAWIGGENGGIVLFRADFP
jgi:ligand-binding sensor domain-containing protein